jgi:hypothetical protein
MFSIADRAVGCCLVPLTPLSGARKSAPYWYGPAIQKRKSEQAQVDRGHHGELAAHETKPDDQNLNGGKAQRGDADPLSRHHAVNDE